MYPDIDLYKEERSYIIPAGASHTIKLFPVKQTFLKSIQLNLDSDITVNSFQVNDVDLTGETNINFQAEFGSLISYKSVEITVTNNGNSDESVKIDIRGIRKE